MKKGIAKLTAFVLAAGFTFGEGGAVMMVSAAPTTQEETSVPEYGFAKCKEYVNIRATADKDGELVGTIQNNGYMNIQSIDENGWYHVTSGNVEGYIASQYVVTGNEADVLADEVGYKTAEVGAVSLNMRAEANDESAVVGSVEESEKVEVVADEGEWVKVVKDGTYGYVSHDYVYVSKEFKLAETPEEMQIRLGNEWASEQSSVSEESYAQEAPADTYVAETSAPADNYVAETSAPADTYVEETSAPADTYVEETSAPEEYYEESYVEETSAPEEYYEESYVEETSAPEETYVEETSAPEETYVEETSAPEEYYEESYVEETSAPEEYYEETSAPADTYVEETEAPAAPAASSTGQAIANYACQFVGNPYVYGGTSLTNGADCSGFVMSVFANFGISLPHYSGSQMGYGYAVSADQLAPGDLVFYGAGGSQHVAIYIGGGAIVHAANSRTGITTSDMYWSGTPTGYRRLV